MGRVLSRHGNVIATDFRPRPQFDITLAFKSETLYRDGLVMLMRTTALLDDKPIFVLHFLVDLATGHIVQLNHG